MEKKTIHKIQAYAPVNVIKNTKWMNTCTCTKHAAENLVIDCEYDKMHNK